MWPIIDESKIVVATAIVAVQVNGKLRGTVEIATDATQEQALKAARENKTVQKWLDAGEEIQAVYVPNKVINFVVE